MPKSSAEEVSTTQDVFVPLNAFAQANATKHGIELMGGFYHAMETQKPPHLVDTEENWHALVEKFKKQVVK